MRFVPYGLYKPFHLLINKINQAGEVHLFIAFTSGIEINHNLISIMEQDFRHE